MPGEIWAAGNPSMTTMRSVITMMKMISVSLWIMMIPSKAVTTEVEEIKETKEIEVIEATQPGPQMVHHQHS